MIGDAVVPWRGWRFVSWRLPVSFNPFQPRGILFGNLESLTCLELLIHIMCLQVTYRSLVFGH